MICDVISANFKMNTQIVNLADTMALFGTIKNYTLKQLTAPGENYGSLMLRLDMTVENQNITSEINAVVKMLPPNLFLQEMFNTEVTFRKEIMFYKTIIPTLQQFQRDHNVQTIIDFVPRYYGSRLNLKNDYSAKVDEHAILVLENLKVDNFVNEDKTVGVSLDVAKMVLSDLAQLHAIPIALKTEKPEVFEEVIMPHLGNFYFPEKMLKGMKEQLRETLKKVPELKPFEERLWKMFNNLYNHQKPNETWSTISHNDCWTNNTMVKISDGQPIKTKLIDFQIFDYGSLAKDVVFFLFSSVNSTVLNKHYNELTKWYHSNFIKTLEQLNSNTSPYSFSSFLEELKYEGNNIACAHVFFMTFHIFKLKGTVKDIDKLTQADMECTDITELQKDKLIFIVKQFAQRNWI